MENNTYRIPSFRVPCLPLQVIGAVLLPVAAFLFKNIFGLSGIVILLAFWIVPILMLFVFYPKSKRNFVEISKSGVLISQNGNNFFLDWNDIKKVGFQAIISKRLGVYECDSFLGFGLVNPAIDKARNLSSKEYGFIVKKSDLNGYMHEDDKYDIYVNCKFLEEKDSNLKDFLSKIPSNITHTSPLVKTDKQEEYDSVKSNFSCR